MTKGIQLSAIPADIFLPVFDITFKIFVTDNFLNRYLVELFAFFVPKILIS